MQVAFGSGSVWGVPITTVTGTAITTPTPVKFGVLQDVSVDFDFPTKMLYGTYQMPVAVGRGKAKISGKAKLAQLNADMMASIVFGQSGQPATGQTTISEDEPGTIPGTPYQVTVVNSATWTTDLGVWYTSGANSGMRLVRVASAPTTGQYSVAAGVYTFAAADTTLGVAISYEYTLTGGFTINIANQLLGNIPTFRAVLKTIWSGKTLLMDLYNCVSEKFSIATKIDDFAIPECDFEAFANAANNIGVISLVEQ